MSRNDSIFRNTNIIKEFNAASGTNIIDVYQPGLLSPFDAGFTNLRFSGYITSLRLQVDVSSISEIQAVEINELDSDATIDQKTKDTFNNNQKKCLTLYIRSTYTQLIKINDVYLFNNRPYYYIDLLNYLTSSATFDVAPDTVISAGIRDVGDGLLLNEDRLLLLGTAIEETTYKDEAIIINNITYGNTQAPIQEVDSVPLPTNIKTIVGDSDYVFMIDNQGQPYKVLKTLLFQEIINQIPQQETTLQQDCLIVCNTNSFRPSWGKAIQKNISGDIVKNIKIQVRGQIPNLYWINDTIQIHRWEQVPNDNMFGRIFYLSLPAWGGEIKMQLTDGLQYFSIFARNSDKSNFFDCCQISMEDNIVWIEGF